MATKPLYEVPAKPRGLEAITIDRVKFMKLLEAEKVKQAKRASAGKRAHQKKVTEMLTKALANVKAGRPPGLPVPKYESVWSISLPQPPTFNPCQYDELLHRLSNDDRDTLVLSATQWSSYFPCSINGEEE